jgi:AcrR family transcriptional regulator
MSQVGGNETGTNGTASVEVVADAGEPSKVPRTARGQRTRERLIVAARSIFERDGYLDARLLDISKEAGVAAGSFYVYFSGKGEIFAAVLERVQSEMLHPRVGEDAPHSGQLVVDIEAANRAYLDWYKKNALFMRALEQAATSDAGLREVRRKRGEAFAQRNARRIRELQDKGLADPGLDPLLAAKAVDGMVGRMAYATYVLGDECEHEDLVVTLTKLWLNALRIDCDDHPGGALAGVTAGSGDEAAVDG